MVKLIATGDHALLARTGARLTPGAYRRALGLWRALSAAPLPGVVDLALAYASVLVHFDPLVTDARAVAEGVRAAYGTSHAADQSPAAAGRLITMPVCYGGRDGPDLEDVAARLGLTPEALIRRHARPRYHVYFLGFTAGFPYLGGLPAALAAPRLDTPRTLVPAGSVGIAGRQTGIYPAATPGGWRLIGRTPVHLYDPLRTPAALLQPGDSVRFVPVRGGDAMLAGKPAPIGHEAVQSAYADSTEAAAAASISPDGAKDGLNCIPWLRVIQPGALTTVQDRGRPGYAAQGVAAGGAVDRDALRLGNLLVGNPPDAAGLEITLGMAMFEALAPCVVAMTGADCAVRVGGRPIARWRVALVPAGARIELDRWRSGARAYLAVAGGVALPPVLGSRATDLRAAMGGLAGRALRPGDELPRGAVGLRLAALAGRRLPDDLLCADPVEDVAVLRLLPGPHAAAYPRDLDMLLSRSFAVDPRSDRMGARLVAEGAANGEPGAVGGDVLSEGVPDGAVQLPPGGQPVLLLADHQTTGGYRVPAVVVSADQSPAAQLRPGARVRFALATEDEALAALRAREAWFSAIAARLAMAGGAGGERIAVARLFGGFAEGSEETNDDE